MSGVLVYLYRQGGMTRAWYETSSPFDGLDLDDEIVEMRADGTWRNVTVGEVIADAYESPVVKASRELNAEARNLRNAVLDAFRPMLDWMAKRLA